ncbi:MAG TPA: amidohydrolase family protein [Pseudonocardiaceae bacterium]|jgi:hypothetical protein|nr:amidohydrolase family protein [Pseudonocardiaceae bacterium]
MAAQAVFDFHTRLVPGPDPTAALLGVLDRSGVDRAAVCAGGMISLDRLAEQIMVGGHSTQDADNEGVLVACQGTSGRLVPFFFGNPHTDPAEYRALAADFRGIEISPAVHGVPLTDDRVLGLVEIAAEFSHVVYVVCIGREGCGAEQLVALADKFPEVPFVLGHCGFIGIDAYSVNVIADRPSISVETSGAYSILAATAVRRLGPQRVLYGSEFPVSHPEVELAKLRVLDLDPVAQRQILWSNAHRLLGEETSA